MFRPLREPCCTCEADACEQWFTTHCLQCQQGTHQPHSQTRAQLNFTQWYAANAWAHHDQSPGGRSTDYCPGARAQGWVWPGVWAGYSALTVGILIEYKGKEEGPAHIPTAKGELQLASVDLSSLFDPFLLSSTQPCHLCWFLPVMNLLNFCFHPALYPLYIIQFCSALSLTILNLSITYVTPIQPQEPSPLLWPVILLALLDFLTSSVQPESCTCLPPHLTPSKHSFLAPLLSASPSAHPSASSRICGCTSVLSTISSDLAWGSPVSVSSHSILHSTSVLRHSNSA